MSQFLGHEPGDFGEDAEEYDADDEVGEELVLLISPPRDEVGGNEGLPWNFGDGTSLGGRGRRCSISQRQRGHEVEDHVPREHNGRAEDERLPVRFEDASDRGLGDLLLRRHELEGRGLQEGEPAGRESREAMSVFVRPTRSSK